MSLPRKSYWGTRKPRKYKSGCGHKFADGTRCGLPKRAACHSTKYRDVGHYYVAPDTGFS